jgi:glycosyltransferase involved in cell wall biosynthesis
MRLAEALNEMGHEATIFGMDDARPRVGRRLDHVLFPVHASVRAARRLASGSVDVVDSSTGDLGLLPRSFVARRRGVVVARSQGLEHVEAIEAALAAERQEVPPARRHSIFYGKSRLAQVARSLRHADAVVFQNSDERQWAVDNLHLEPSRAVIISNGIADRFLGLPPIVPSGSEPVGVAVIGPYMWRKGAATATAVLSSVLQEWPQTHVRWLGADVDEVKGGFAQELHHRVDVVPHYAVGELPNLLKDCQVLLFLSRAEAFGIAVVEALACGLAVVATDTQGPKQILAGTDAGLLVPPGDVEAAYGAMSRLLKDRDLLDRMRVRGQARAQSYGVRTIAVETAELYARVAAEKRAG